MPPLFMPPPLGFSKLYATPLYATPNFEIFMPPPFYATLSTFVFLCHPHSIPSSSYHLAVKLRIFVFFNGKNSYDVCNSIFDKFQLNLVKHDHCLVPKYSVNSLTRYLRKWTILGTWPRYKNI